jgi:hypothetical protein
LWWSCPSRHVPPLILPVLAFHQDSDSEERTDAPAGQSLVASLDESEEERRSPGSEHWRTPGREQRKTPVEMATDIRHLELTKRSPPGLGLFCNTDAAILWSRGSEVLLARCTSAWRPPPPPIAAPPAPMVRAGNIVPSNGPTKDGADSCEDEEEDEDADDELDLALGHPANCHSTNNAFDSAWYSKLPSIGSANHFTGTCDRCCFHPKGRCLNGYDCQHCHFDHEKRKRKNKKKTKGKLSSMGD